MDPISTVLLTWGPPGAIIIVLGMVCRHLYVALRESQEARISDAKKVVELSQTMNDKFHQSVSSLQQTLDHLRDRGEGLYRR